MIRMHIGNYHIIIISPNTLHEDEVDGYSLPLVDDVLPTTFYLPLEEEQRLTLNQLVGGWG